MPAEIEIERVQSSLGSETPRNMPFAARKCHVADNYTAIKQSGMASLITLLTRLGANNPILDAMSFDI